MSRALRSGRRSHIRRIH